ncbi:LPXTG-site transpeptidase (sortase) family protein [Trichococcus patagoniensis]|uniref:LPXTG-site transpeptidase (Sortase) family protein n=1 Tax=Trichococcus patagoniensis TaxID=382641 RepID=A0A2T5IAW2_9LACT|nr:class C sortase [Trichococcus patagoniensis]PTQ80959.1 LPXTG-site transpeptidase (sortase) family protein [Trichococcus patagoniensis]
MKNKKKNRYLLLFILGVSIILVPQMVIFYNNLGQQNQIEQYKDTTADLNDYQIQQFFTEAASINNNNIATADSENDTELPAISAEVTDTVPNHYPLSDPFTNQMTSGGNQPSLIAEDDVFGFIEIPKVEETLPIYLGATPNNLAKGVAQVTESSLPTGGSGTHSVIAGHRGYYGATFFRYIDQLEPGDLFYIHVLNKVLTYRVTGQATIDPDDTSSLGIVDGADLVTLLTCTPYPTDRYRLLIYGSRVYDEGEPVEYATASDEPLIGEADEEDAENIGIQDSSETFEQSSDSAVSEYTENKVENQIENQVPQSSGNTIVQILTSENEISTAARNHKLINRIIITAGLLSIAVSAGLIMRNKRKE